jgi:hypothetical protein
MWGTIFVLSVIVFAAFISFKLFMPYKDYFKVVAALESAIRQSGGSISKEDLVASLQKRFSVDDIEHVDLAKDLKVEVRGSTQVFLIDYEVEVPIAGNLFILLKFKTEKQVRSSG